MNKLRLGVGMLAIAVALGSASPVKAYIIPIMSDYEAYMGFSPDMREFLESELTRWKQDALKRKEMDYTDKVGEQGQGDDGQSGLQKVPGVKDKQSEIITETRKSAKNGGSAISNTSAGVDTSGLKGYSAYNNSNARNQSTSDWVVHANIGDTYSQSQLKTIHETQGTNLNLTAANAIAYGAVETVNAAVDAAQSNKEDRAKQMAKGQELSSATELMLGEDRRIYERSLHAAALDATAAGVEAMKALQSISKSAEGQHKMQ